MKYYIASILPFILSANAQDVDCTDERFGLEILTGPPRGEGDVFSDLPLGCSVSDPYLGRVYDCRELRQISAARCAVEVEMPVDVTMQWEIKNEQNKKRVMMMDETWVDFTGSAVTGGTERVTPTFTDLTVGEGGIAYVPGGSTKTLTASVTVDKCQNSFDAKLRIQQRVTQNGVATFCPKRFVTKDLMLRTCPISNSVQCFVKGPNSDGFNDCDTVMDSIRNASAEERGTLFAEEFCAESSKVEYVYELCSASNLRFAHKTTGAKQTRAFLKYSESEDDQEDLSPIPRDDLEKGECQEFKVTVPSVTCDGTEADPTSLFPVGIFDVNGRMRGQNQDKVDRKYSGCWERTTYGFDQLDTAPPGGPDDVPCTEAPTVAPTPSQRKLEDAALVTGFVLPESFKGAGKGAKKCKSGKGKGGSVRRRH